MTSSVSIPLTELLLRPSTLRRFTKRGFESTDEIEESRENGGINLLASELDVSLQEAAGLIREVQGCLGSYQRAKNGVGEGDIRTGNDKDLSTSIDDKNNAEDAHRFPQPTRHCDDGIVTAYELLQMDTRRDARIPGKKHHLRKHIVTFCRSIDDLIGGGIALGEVTEIAGMPGTGKTQLATQLSVLARLPHIYGGVEGRTLYVDAEGSFLAERAHSMANALCHHVRGRAHHQQDGSPDGFTTEGILDAIDVFRVHDEAALLATLYSLRNYIESSASSSQQSSTESSELPVRLIIIDSIAFHFRAVAPTDPSYYVQRTKTLTALAAYLGDLAHQHNLAVVVINQMTTKMSSNASSVVPALGESWAHATATRLLLSKEGRYRIERSGSEDDETLHHRVRSDLRICSLIKSAHKPTGTANYRILEEGIRDVPSDREQSRRNDTGSNKRSRTTH